MHRKLGRQMLVGNFLFGLQVLVYVDEECLSLGTLIGWKALVLWLAQMLEVWLLRKIA
jgi:hypothetical protein